MSAGSDFSIEVGVRVRDDATPALQRIGRTASTAGRDVESSMRNASRELGTLGASAGRSTVGVQTAARQWESAARRGGQNAGRAAGDGLVAGMRGRTRNAASDIRNELMAPLAAGVAGAGIVQFFKGAIDKASDLNETVSKSQAIFEGQSGAMQKWSQGAAQSMGLSSQAALDAATSFGDMFRQLGDSGPTAARTSQQVVQLAADLGSFNNLDTGDVIERLSAAFRGEYDSLQAIIPNINAARVEQEALTETGKKSASALTQQEKAHATLSIVMKDSARAQGDFAKTSDGAANTAKRNAAAFADLQAKVGQGLLSAFQALQGAMGGVISGAGLLVDGIAKIASVFSSLPGPLQMAIGTFGAMRVAQMLLSSQFASMGSRVVSLGGAFRSFSSQQTAASVASANLASNMTRSAAGVGRMVTVAGGGVVQMGRFGTSIAQIGQQVPAIARAQTAFLNASTGATRFGRSAGTAAAGASLLRTGASGLMGMMGGPLGLAFAGASVAAGLWAKHQQDSAQKVAEHKASVAQLTGTLNQSTGAFTAATRAQAAKELSDKGLLASAEKYHLSLSQVTDAYLGQPGAIEAVNRSLDEQNTKYSQANSYYNEHGRLIEVNDSANRKLKDSLNDVAGSGKEAQEALRRQNAAMKESSSASKQAANGVLDYQEASKRAKTANDAMRQSLEKMNNTFLELRGGVRGYEAALDDAAKALQENGRTLDVHTEKGRANAEALDKVASSAQTMIADMSKNGASAADIGAKYASSRAELMKLAQSYGMTASEAKSYTDQALQVPATVKTAVEADTAAASSALSGIKSDALSVNGQTIKIKADSLPADKMKSVLDGVVGARKNADGSISITANPANVEHMRLTLKNMKDVAVSADGKIINIKGATNAGQVKQLIESLGVKAAEVNGKKVTIHTSNPLAAAKISELSRLKGVAVSADGKSVTIDTSAPGAVQAESQVRAALNAAHDKTVTITVQRRIQESIDSWKQLSPFGHSSSARGNVFEGGRARHFARGGVEDHQPQVARGGDWRVWAEPETQGEAYIPFANDDRRPRAKKITEYVAQKFGGSVTWHATGSATGSDDWTPDMSGIMAYAQSLRVDPQALTDQRKKVSDQQSALNKAIRDLKAAQAGLRGKSGAARVKAENAVATAIERQAKAQRDLNDGKAKLSQMSAGAKADTTTRFLMGTTSQNGITKKFLDNIERIKGRGFPRLARSLLEQGDSDAQAIAQTLVGGPLSRLQQAQKGLDASDALADRKKALSDQLSGATLTASAQQQANAQLIALRAANNRQSLTGGVIKVEAPKIDYGKLAQQIRIDLPPVQVTSLIDGQQVGQSVTSWQETRAGQGSVMPGLKL